jgi:hypothetical protein
VEKKFESDNRFTLTMFQPVDVLDAPEDEKSLWNEYVLYNDKDRRTKIGAHRRLNPKSIKSYEARKLVQTYIYYVVRMNDIRTVIRLDGDLNKCYADQRSEVLNDVSISNFVFLFFFFIVFFYIVFLFCFFIFFYYIIRLKTKIIIPMNC